MQIPGMESQQQRRRQRSRSTTEESDKAPTPVKHNTRSQSGYPMKKKMRYSPSNEQEDDRLGELIEEGTHILSTIDRASDRQELIKDAISLCDRVVFPMCFPWSHHVDTVGKVIPRDIDEMQCIAKLGGLEDTFTALKKLEPIRLSVCPSDMKASSRRTEDIGVIELSVVRYRSMGQKRAESLVNPPSCQQGDTNNFSSLVKCPKRKYHDECDPSVNLTILKSKEISLRLNSTSTKSTLFDCTGPSVPLLLHAIMSQSGQEGNGSEASSLQSISRFQGSNDSSATCIELSKLNNGKNSTLSGRTRLVWTERRHFQRPYFRSILSGEKLEGNTYQRPRSVRVGLRVNGKLLTTTDTSAKHEVATLCAMLDNMPNHCPNFKDTVVHEAVRDVFDTEPSSLQGLASNLQCSLSADKMARNVLDGLRSKPHIDSSSFREKQHVHNLLHAHGTQPIETTGEEAPCMVEPPRLDCGCGEDGLVKVFCTKPGKFSVRKVGTFCELHENSKRPLCAVCWASVDPSADTNSQDEKKFHVHDNCRTETASFSEDEQCFVCDNIGGYGVHWKGAWVHETCRIWSGPMEGQTESVCVFCGKLSRWVTKCVADGCLVCFHPMCAVLASQAMAPPVRDKGIEMSDNPEVARDVYLCTRFVLATANLRASVAVPSFEYKTVLPVAFCGFHNPKRRSDYYGLYPGGLHLTNAVTVPFLRVEDDTAKS